MILRRALIYSALFFVLILGAAILGGAFFQDKLLSPYVSAALTILAVVGLGSYVDFGKSFISWVENRFFRSRTGLKLFLVAYAVLVLLFLGIVACTVEKHHYRATLSALVPGDGQAIAEVHSPQAAERIRYLAVTYPDRDDWKIVLDAVSNQFRRDDGQYRRYNRFVIESIFGVGDAETAPAMAFDFGRLPDPAWYCLCDVARPRFASFELFVLKFAAQGLADSPAQERAVTDSLLATAPDGMEVALYRAILGLGDVLGGLYRAIKDGSAGDRTAALQDGRTAIREMEEIFAAYPRGTLSRSDVYLLAQDHLAQVEIYACHLGAPGATERMFAAYEDLLGARQRETGPTGAAPVWFFEPQKFILYAFVSNVRARSLQHGTDESFTYYTGLCAGIDPVLSQLERAFPRYWGDRYDENWRAGTVTEAPLSRTVGQVLSTGIYQDWRTN